MDSIKQRSAIAEWMGCKPRMLPLYFPDGKYQDGWYWPNGEYHKETPNYPADLNAMREAEKRLEDDAQRRIYLIELTKACGNIEDSTLGSNFWVCTHATAAQRAEALLKTIGKWTQTDK